MANDPVGDLEEIVRLRERLAFLERRSAMVTTCPQCATMNNDGPCPHGAVLPGGEGPTAPVWARLEALERRVSELAFENQRLRAQYDGAVSELRALRRFIERVASGGAIVSSAALPVHQIALADYHGRLLVTADGLGFVYITGVSL